jgi:TP901 family phage tail tape measure protein
MANTIDVNVGFTEEGLKKIQVGVEQLKEKLLQIKIDDASAQALKRTEDAAKKAEKAAEDMARPFAKMRQHFDSMKKGFESAAMPLLAINSAVGMISQAFSGLSTAINATVGEAVKLETTMGKIQNLVGGGANTKQVTQDVLAMSAGFGRSAQDIAMQIRETMALGLADNTKDATTIVQKALGGAIATYSDLGTVISGSGKLIQVFNLTAADTSAVIAKMDKAANMGSGTMEQLALQVGQFATIAAMVGANIDEVNVSMGVLTKVDEAGAAAANLSNLFSKLLTPTEDLAMLFDKLGWSNVQAEIKSRGFMTVLKELRQAELKYLGDGKAFVDMQAKKAFSLLMTEQGMTAYDNGLRSMATAEEELATKQARAMASSEERMNRLKETFNVTLLKIGIMLSENVLPPILTFVEAMGAAVSGLINLGKAIGDVMSSLDGVDLTVLTISATAAAGAIIYLNTAAIGALIASIPALIPLVTALGAGFVSMAAPVLAVAAAFAAGYVATRFLVDNLNALVDVVVGGLMEAFASMASTIVVPFQLMLKALGMVSDKAKEISEDISKTLGGIKEKGAQTFNKATFKIPDFAADLATIKDAASGVFDTFGKSQTAAQGVAKSAKETAKVVPALKPPSDEWVRAQNAVEKMQQKTREMMNDMNDMPEVMARYYAKVQEGEQALDQFKKQKGVTSAQIAEFKKQQEIQAKMYNSIMVKTANKTLTEITQSEEQKERSIMDKQIADIQTLAEKRIIGEQQAIDAIEALKQKQFDKEMERATKQADQQIRLDENVDDERRVKTRNVATGTVGQVRDKGKEDKEASDKEKAKADAQQGVVEGFSAARNGVGSFVTFVASKFGFVGQIIAGIIELLSSPEAAKTFVDSFFGAGIWTFVQQILNRIGSIMVKGIIENIPKATMALIGFLTLGIPEFVANLIAGIVEGISGALSMFGDTKMWENMAKAMFNAFKKAVTSIKKLFNGIFGGKTSGGITTAKATTGAPASSTTGGGKEEFAIRDYSLSASAEGTAEDSAQSEQDSLKSIWGDFLDWLKKGWEQIKDIAKEIGNFITTWIVPVDLIKDGVATIQSKFDEIKNSQPFKLIEDSFNTLVSFITTTWSGVKDVLNIGNIWQSVQDTFSSLTGYISSSWSLLRNNFTLGNIWIVIQDGFYNLKSNIMNGWATVKQTLSIDRIFDAVSNSFMSLVGVIQNSWNNVKNILKIDDIFEKIKTGYTQLKNDILSSWQSVKDIFNFGNIWETVQNTFNSFTGYIKTSWNSLKNDFSFGNIWAIIQNGFDNLKTNIMNGWASVKSTLNIGRIFDALGDSFDSMKNKVIAAWDYLKGILRINNIFEPIETGWNRVTSAISSVWDGIKAKFQIPNPFAALENGWNSLVSKFTNWTGFDLGSKLKLNIDYKGKGTVENFLGMDFPWANFASGGQVGGRAVFGGDSERNDTVPALLSPGEFVVPRSVMAQRGVPDLMMQLMNGASNYASGGVVKAAKGWSLKRIGAAIATGGASEAARAVGLPPPDEYAGVRDTFNGLNAVLGGLDLASFAKNPSGYIGDIVRSKISSLSNMKAMFGFSEGGIVPGPASGDVVPALLSGGEMVLNRQQQQQVSSQSGVITVNINVAAGAVLDRPAIDRAMPQIIDAIRRSSFNGQQVLSPRGVR